MRSYICYYRGRHAIACTVWTDDDGNTTATYTRGGGKVNGFYGDLFTHAHRMDVEDTIERRNPMLKVELKAGALVITDERDNKDEPMNYKEAMEWLCEYRVETHTPYGGLCAVVTYEQAGGRWVGRRRLYLHDSPPGMFDLLYEIEQTGRAVVDVHRIR